MNKKKKNAKQIKHPTLTSGGQSPKEVWEALKDPNG